MVILIERELSGSDFGTARLDQISTNKDSFEVVYTADDSEPHLSQQQRRIVLLVR